MKITNNGVVMKVTNNNGLPKAIFDLIANDNYSRGDADISVTQLIDSPRVRVLSQLHDHEIEIEASTRLALTLGKAFHSAVEKGTITGTAERRLFMEVNGWKISGGVDHYEDGIISDYKTCNVWKSVYADGGKIDEWELQLNVYAQLHREIGEEVKGLKIFALFKDWNKRGFGEAYKKGKLWQPWTSSGYPSRDWEYVNVPLWSSERAKAYILERVRLHQEAEKELPLCSKSDIWHGTRCSSYCNVSKFCTQYENAKKTGLSQGE